MSAKHSIKIRRLLIPAIALVLTSVAAAPMGSHQSPQQRRDYQRLSGEWRLTRAIAGGVPVSKSLVQHTLLITDGDTFRFPDASGVATHAAGRFVINPNIHPKQVDSYAIGGKNAGQLTRGIYEIMDDTHQRECWAPPGAPRPRSFEPKAGTKFICQYWRKIGPVPKDR